MHVSKCGSIVEVARFKSIPLDSMLHFFHVFALNGGSGGLYSGGGPNVHVGKCGSNVYVSHFHVSDAAIY